jgi:hypothetical protein
LAYADDVNLLGDDINTIKRNAEVLLEAGRQVGLEVNSEKTKYMLVSRHQKTGGQNYLRVANKSFERLEVLRHQGVIALMTEAV